MASFAMTVPYMRTSPVHIPRRDLVLGSADSLFLRVTVVDSDNTCAQALETTGGVGGPALQMIVWPDTCYRTSWDYGARPHHPQAPLWTGQGTISDAIGAFDIAFPGMTMADWPRRCIYALQLDWGGGGLSLLAEGHLHLRWMRATPVAVVAILLLTDDSIPVLTDSGVNVLA